MVRNLRGAYVRRVIDRSGANVAEHAHDWPVLSIFVPGGYRNQTELGEVSIAGPSAILYRAREAHSNRVGPLGFEQIEIEFDPDWLGRTLIPTVPVTQWFGGPAGAESRSLARLCGFEGDEDRLRAALRQFVHSASRQTQLHATSRIHTITQRSSENPILGAKDLAPAAQR